MRRTTTAMTWLATVVWMAACLVAEARNPPQPPLTERGERLLARYETMLASVRQETAAAAPGLDAAAQAAFVAAHKAVADIPPRPNPNNLRNAPPRYAPGHDAYDAAQSVAALAAQPLLAAADAFLASDAWDTPLARGALLAHATPRGLAAFAQQGDAEETLIEELLQDDELVRQVMAMGGAFEGNYGQAMQSYRAIQKASPRARDGLFQRFALASCLEHPDRSVPETDLTAEELGVAPGDLQTSDVNGGRTAADVMVEIYLDYEQAYLDGHLDAAFDSFDDFNYRFVFPEYELEHVVWFREMLRNYRPDHVVNPDHTWRYCGIVRTDVPYTSGVRRPVRPDLRLSRFQDFFLEGGICGPRAFVGKLSTSAFGIPTRGARQTGHAAMSRWTPDGWTTVLGAHWTYNSWRGRTGLDFFLETQARRAPREYLKVLRAQWLGDVLGETPVSPMNYGVGGGPWNALAFYKKLAIVEEARIAALAPVGEELSEANEETAPEVGGGIEIDEAHRRIVVADDGVITIPPGAATSTANTGKIRFMKTIDGDGVQVHYSLGGARPELLSYAVEVAAAGTYELTATVCTVTVDREFLLRLNRRTMIDIPLPYTKGLWADTPPVEVELRAGRNALQFTAASPNKGFSIRAFTLRPTGRPAAAGNLGL